MFQSLRVFFEKRKYEYSHLVLSTTFYKPHSSIANVVHFGSNVNASNVSDDLHILNHGQKKELSDCLQNFIHKTSTAMTKDHHISEHCLRAYKDGYPFYSTSQYIADRNCIFSGEWNKEQRETRFFIKKYNISPGSGTETAILWLLSTNRSGRCREYRFW